MLERLPDIIILDLLSDTPQLRFVSRRFYGLSELRIRTRLLSSFDNDDEHIEDFALDIRKNLQIESWELIEGLALKDYWFFGPEHVIESNNYPGSNSLTGKKGYYVVNGAPWGLYVVHWANRYLEYKTVLRAGTYDVFLDVSTPHVLELSKTRISFFGSPSVVQHFKSTPPAYTLESQLNKADEHWPDEIEGSTHYGSLRSSNVNGWQHDPFSAETIELLIGTLEVGTSENNGWVEVGLRLESIDWSEPLTGVIYNYMSFKQRDQNSSPAKQWTLQPPQPSSTTPTYALSLFYKRANERKRQWSLEGARWTGLSGQSPSLVK